jgi:hypothetical protein
VSGWTGCKRGVAAAAEGGMADGVSSQVKDILYSVIFCIVSDCIADWLLLAIS